MEKNRLEAFSDGVIAIIITIMVLELKIPHGADLAALRPLAPTFLSYVLSFVFVAIYWNNHHHMLQTAHRVNGGVLWANMHLLFWLSIVPFVTAWIGDTHMAVIPVAAYGVVMLSCAIAYSILARVIVAAEGHDSALARALGRDFKGKLSLAFYVAAIPAAFVSVWVSLGLYVSVSLMWLIPDRRIERAIAPN